ncbi:MAG: 3-isopropylmalate dehydratase [Candidatus Thorarchaeota archaeon]|nr:3-isopropylmalate dehydratase [Candidatus Thorarchaeota archaeon]
MSDRFDKITGKVRLFGDDVNTDQIIQGRYLTLLDYSEMAKHTFEVVRPNFVNEMERGDVVIAGRNFGSGSSREEAPMVLKEVGISCVIAESFSRIFYRNAFNIGLPALIVPGITEHIKEGQTVEINLADGLVQIKEMQEEIRGDCIPDRMLSLLRAGGAVAWYKQQKQ